MTTNKIWLQTLNHYTVCAVSQRRAMHSVSSGHFDITTSINYKLNTTNYISSMLKSYKMLDVLLFNNYEE